MRIPYLSNVMKKILHRPVLSKFNADKHFCLFWLLILLLLLLLKHLLIIFLDIDLIVPYYL